MSDALITRLDRWLSTKRADYHAKLRPRATPAQLDAFEQKFSVKLPADFRALYQWRHGNSGYASFQFNRMFAPLGDIADSKDLLDGMIGTDFEDPKWWRRGWVPFLLNGGAPGQIRVFYHDTARRPIEHLSFQA